jgi:hypothetical protein
MIRIFMNQKKLIHRHWISLENNSSPIRSIFPMRLWHNSPTEFPTSAHALKIVLRHSFMRKGDLMATNYQQLALNDIEVGAILADDVRDDHGVVLLAQGTCLNQSLIKSLARHGVETLPIVCTEASEEITEPTTDEAAILQQQERVKRLFRLENCDEASGLLHVFVEQYRQGVTA